MKIVTVCGLGMGSSLIMKMTVESVIKDMGIKGSIEHWDMGTIKGKTADLIITTDGFKKQFAEQDNVVFITNIVDKVEMKTKLTEYFDKVKENQDA